MRYVTPGYFATLGIPLVAGRDVSDADTAGTLQVAVVSQSFVDRYWPGRERDRPALPLRPARRRGDQQRAALPGPDDRRRRRRRQGARPRAAQRAAGLPAPPSAARGRDGLVHAAGPRGPVHGRRGRDRSGAAPDRGARRPGPADRRRAHARDDRGGPDGAAPRAGARAGRLRRAGRAARGRRASTACSPSWWRAARARSASGARSAPRPPTSWAWCCATACVSHCAGVGLGLVLAWAAGRSLEALLAGVSPRDAATFAAAAALVAAAALAGSLLPALRAVRVDPLKALRVD